MERKRNTRWSSKGIFSPRNGSKTRIHEHSGDHASVCYTNVDGVINIDLEGYPIHGLDPKKRKRSRLSRSSKILSYFWPGRRQETEVIRDPSTDSPTRHRIIALALARDAASPQQSNRYSGYKSHVNNGGVARDGHFGSRPFINMNMDLPFGFNFDRHGTSGVSETSEDYQDSGFDRRLGKKNRLSLRHSVSSPGFSSSGLTHRLSHKLSRPFVQPTVVHRPELRERPSAISLRNTSDMGGLPWIGSVSPGVSDLSSYYTSGGTTPAEPASTAKTSVVSEDDSVGSDDMMSVIQHPVYKIRSMPLLPDEKPLTPIQESLYEPTITTVETTAAAKVFFETHFNQLLSMEGSARSQRRRQLEAWLVTGSLTTEEQLGERQKFIQSESEYLRQMRILKSRDKNKENSKGVTVGGYEVVKVLGKGSFGVVRLVREKENECIPPVGPSTVLPGASINWPKAASNRAMKRSSNNLPSLQKVYAMKVIRKSEMLRNSQEGHIRAERDFLVASEGSRWIIPLIASFQDLNHLYLVMNFMQGGDFLGLLIRKNTLSEEETKFYMAEMILCVEEAHSLKWIHRDVKPDNFLIDEHGHLKISDFGLAFDGHWAHDQNFFNNHRQSLMEALDLDIEGDSLDRREAKAAAAALKLANVMHRHEGGPARFDGQDNKDDDYIIDLKTREGMRKLARSIVGTSQYMAPEVIRGEQYDGRCDWWSVGIILYECLFGYTPFCCDSRQETKMKILRHGDTLIFPGDKPVSETALDLIKKLLVEKEHRLSSKKYIFNDYKCSKQKGSFQFKGVADREAKDYRGTFVYPNDGSDIKRHPFFKGIEWDRIHLMKAPIIPKLESHEDTKYFDDEESISDMGDSSSYVSAREQQESPHKTNDAFQLGGKGTSPVKSVNPLPQEQQVASSKNKKNKEKKRPRDKALRDKVMGRHVLALRKKGSFVGYTWRRPRTWKWEEEEKLRSERDKVAWRRTKLPSIS